MTLAIRRLSLVGVLFVFVTAACSAAAPSASPSALPSVAPTTSASVAPSATPGATSTPASTVVPSAAACAELPQDIQMPSDRLTDIKVTPGASADRLTFVFGNPSLLGEGGPPQGALEVGRPPYTHAGSGASIDMVGEHVVQVLFTGMSIMNDVGQPTYAGVAEIKPGLPALRHAVLFDESEGYVGWYIGYDGAGCVTVARDGNGVTVIIEHR